MPADAFGRALPRGFELDFPVPGRAI